MNIDLARWLRWNEDEQITIVTLSERKGDIETPEQIFEMTGRIRK
jgi:hypothetical protein